MRLPLTCFFKNARLQGDLAAAFNAIIESPEQAARLKAYAKPYKAIKGLKASLMPVCVCPQAAARRCWPRIQSSKPATIG